MYYTRNVQLVCTEENIVLGAVLKYARFESKNNSHENMKLNSENVGINTLKIK